MAWDNAVVTNSGVAMLQQVLAGGALVIDGAAGGTDTVTPSALMAQTALKNQKQAFPIVGVTNVTNGKKLNIMITNNGLAAGYLMQQVGIWAHVGSNPSALFAILQDETGVNIPSSGDIPDFALNFYAVINFSNDSDFSLTVDTTALVNVGMLTAALEPLQAHLAESASQISDIVDLITPSKNLFNKIAVTTGSCLKYDTGAITVLAGTFYSDYIEVNPSTIYTISKGLGSSAYGHCFYDKDKVYISGVNSPTPPLTFTTPANTRYIRISGYTVDLDALQLEAGSAVTEYEPFKKNVAVEVNITIKKYNGKAFVTFGDSITWYDGQVRNSADKAEGTIAVGYQSYMRKDLQCTVNNQGSNGATMTTINNRIHAFDYTNIDCVTITGGVNNFRNDMDVGTVQPIGSVFNTATYAGALQDAIEYILTNHPTVKIFLLTPIKGWDDTRGLLPETYSEAMLEVGKLYSLPVCDWYHLSGINDLTKLTYIGDKDDSPDNGYLHPSDAGYKRMADVLIPFLVNH